MLQLTLRQLLVFESTARNLSFSRAAEEMHLTQPGVSTQLKNLEERIGMPLFEQMGRRIFLTEAGREVFNHARAIQQQLTFLERSIDQLRDTKQGKIKVSAVTGTASHLALQLIAKYTHAFPGVRVNLNVANRESVLSELASNETDLAIMGQPPEGLGLAAKAFMKNPLVVIAPPDHPLARQRGIPLSALGQREIAKARVLTGQTPSCLTVPGQVDHRKHFAHEFVTPSTATSLVPASLG